MNKSLEELLWRGDLAKRRTAPLGCEAALFSVIPILCRLNYFWGRFATQRG
jgi:hypothetical protein